MIDLTITKKQEKDAPLGEQILTVIAIIAVFVIAGILRGIL